MNHLNALSCVVAIVAILLGFLWTSFFLESVDDENHRLIRWIELHGGHVDSRLHIRDDRQIGRGLFVRPDVENLVSKDEPLYSVSEECFFSTKTIQDPNKSKSARLWQDESSREWLSDDTIRLAIALMVERNMQESSFWKNYLDSIPPEYPDQPLFWSEAELSELQSPWIVQQIQTSKKFLLGQRSILVTLSNRFPELFSSDNDDEPDGLMDEFVWAFYTVTSRAFDVGRPGDPNRVLGLVPFVDLVNHAFSEPNVKHSYVIKVEGGAVFFAGKSMKSLSENTEVRHSYNTMVETTRYLYMYGMIDPNYEESVKGDFVLLRQSGSLWQVHWNGWLDPALASTYRHDSIADELTNSSPIELLASKVRLAIEKLPTSLEEDLKLLTSARKTSPHTSALLLRIRYKRILARLVHWLEDATKHNDSHHSWRDGDDFKTSRALYCLDV